MSIEKMRALICDRCGMRSAALPADQGNIRDVMRANGWRTRSGAGYTSGEDVCPACQRIEEYKKAEPEVPAEVK